MTLENELAHADKLEEKLKPSATVHELPTTTRADPAKLTSTQQIARMILQLPWREAEAMGNAIEEHKKDGKSQTAAIQNWAWQWKIFKEEDQPSSGA
jgi:hypothetical protein